MRIATILLLLLAPGLTACSDFDDWSLPLLAGWNSPESGPPTLKLRDEPLIAGRLVVSTFADHPGGGQRSRHRTELFNRPSWAGMEDNDLRGFLDGAFVWGWNQVGQVHVRIGRRTWSPHYGEHELFRVIQRWEGIRLAPHARVEAASLELTVEQGPEAPVRLLLYEVKKDWRPGQGGVLSNNNSPPRKGEVWWRDLAHDEEPWGLPGAGFASDTDPDADTPEMPLAVTIYNPGDETLLLRSPALADYVSRRVRQGEPVLLLLKLSDTHEDQPGTLLTVYSGDHGDSANPARRPRLCLEWVSDAELDSVDHDLLLEHGRTVTLPRRNTSGGVSVAASFEPAPGSSPLTLELRSGGADGASAWQPFDRPLRLAEDAAWFQVRVRGVVRPVVLGTPFEADMADTWVQSAAPEDQLVVWTFESPTGLLHHSTASYAGDYRWRVSFAPDELGLWSYYWQQRFTGETFRSASGRFDVVAGDRRGMLDAIRRLEARVGALGAEPSADDRRWAEIQLARLERAAVALHTPEQYRGAAGHELRDELNRVRARLDKPVPDPVPLRANPPPPWARQEKNPP